MAPTMDFGQVGMSCLPLFGVHLCHSMGMIPQLHTVHCAGATGERPLQVNFCPCSFCTSSIILAIFRPVWLVHLDMLAAVRIPSISPVFSMHGDAQKAAALDLPSLRVECILTRLM